MGLVSSLLVWFLVDIVQTNVIPKLIGQVPAGYGMTAGKGALFASVVFCTFTVLYLSAKYVRVFTSGDRFQSGICYIVMAGVATFLLSRIVRMGSSFSLVPSSTSASGSTSLTGGLLPWGSMMSALVPAAVLFLGALLLSLADNVPAASKIKRAAIYLVGAIIMIIGSAVIALSAVGW